MVPYNSASYSFVSVFSLCLDMSWLPEFNPDSTAIVRAGGRDSVVVARPSRSGGQGGAVVIDPRSYITPPTTSQKSGGSALLPVTNPLVEKLIPQVVRDLIPPNGSTPKEAFEFWKSKLLSPDFWNSVGASDFLPDILLQRKLLRHLYKRHKATLMKKQGKKNKAKAPKKLQKAVVKSEKKLLKRVVAQSALPSYEVTRTPVRKHNTFHKQVGTMREAVVEGYDYFMPFTTSSATPAVGVLAFPPVNLDTSLFGSNSYLAQVAQNYERYEVLSFEIFYEPNVSTATNGSFIALIDGDPAETAYSVMTGQQAMSAASAHLGKVEFQVFNHSAPIKLHYTKDMRHIPLYTTSSGNITSGNRQTQFGQFVVYGTGSNYSASTTYGNLYVKYKIKFFVRQVTNSLSVNGMAIITGSAGYTTALPFGTAPVISGSCPLTVGTSGSAQKITLPPGYYLVVAAFSGSGAAFTYSAGSGVAVTQLTPNVAVTTYTALHQAWTVSVPYNVLANATNYVSWSQASTISAAANMWVVSVPSLTVTEKEEKKEAVWDIDKMKRQIDYLSGFFPPAAGPSSMADHFGANYSAPTATGGSAQYNPPVAHAPAAAGSYQMQSFSVPKN